MSKLQPISAKLGEVEFRKTLVKQHLGEKNLIPGEPGQEEISQILKQRVSLTRKIFQTLKSQDFPLSPFLEIGAEKGQRSMLLVNEFDAEGVACDISLESLESASSFAKILGFRKIPKLVCADAYHLPFKNDSFPFVFCFETLHHFPDPAPIIAEIHRVLTPGGVFYFGEEPVSQTLNLNLWRRGYHLNFLEKILKIIGILPFISRIGKTEVSYGILEEAFSLKTWKLALSIFTFVETVVQPVFFGPKSFFSKNQGNWHDPQFLTFALIALQGGGIEGLCIKKEGRKSYNSIEVNLICPDCKKAVVKKGDDFFCRHCQRRFRSKNGVLMLLPDKLQKKLYD